MADDADQSSSATDDAVSGTDNIPANKIKSHQGNFSKKDKFCRSIVFTLLPVLFIAIHCIQ